MKNISLYLVGSLLLVGLLALSAAAAPPQVTNFQGKLTDAGGAPVADGAYNLTFRLYNTEAGGFTIWSEAGVPVNTVSGIFTTQLGSAVNPIDNDIFANNDSLWLEIEVGGEILSPRTYLQAAPFAHAAGSLRGWSNFFDTLTIWANPNLARISTYGQDGQEQIRFWGESWGEIFLFDENPANNLSAILTTNGSSGGAELVLDGDDGATDIKLTTDASGDNAAVLPPGSVHSDEMFNEPGFAFAHVDVTGNLDQNGDQQDLVTVEITTPDEGYIVLEGMANQYFNGSAGLIFAYYNIDTAAGGSSNASSIWSGSNEYVSASANQSRIVTLRRVFMVPAGTHTFRLKGEAYSGNAAGSIVYIEDAQLMATYYPTSYGTVVSPVASAAGFDRAVPITTTNRITGQSETSYQVDLRELELKAKEARIQALETELALEKAEREAKRNREVQEPNSLINNPQR